MSNLKVNTAVAQALRDNIIADIERRFQNSEFLTSLSVATLLDPRYKKLYFQNLHAVSQAISKISSEMCNLSSNVTVSAFIPQTTINTPTDDLWSYHETLAAKNSSE
ncbi:hypothetical protein CHUAL_010738 [Chamberlinius hualienensis]